MTTVTYSADSGSFSVHRADATGQLGVSAGRIWASVTYPTIRDPQSSDTNAVCQISTGVFVLENCDF
jgi:hypothetical protein